MDPEPPRDSIQIDEGAIGINLSPLMAKYMTCGDLNQWTKIAASIILKVARTTKVPIYLIPHVTIPSSNDYEFMQQVLYLIQRKDFKITLIPPGYNAAETKWIISKMSLFAGTRTHATIASLSTNVPTLSLAYSIKAQGINLDIFGHLSHVLSPESIDATSTAEKIGSMLGRENEIRNDLKERIPKIQEHSMRAGQYLKEILDHHD
jgi:colanic acid/amylovoran biosynthesis protein